MATNGDFGTLTPLNLDKIYITILDIDEKLQMAPSNFINLRLFFNHSTKLIPNNFHTQPFRREALSYLQNKGVIIDYDIRGFGFQTYAEIELNAPKFQAFKNDFLCFYNDGHVSETEVGDLPFPDNADWDQVQMELCSDESIRIRCAWLKSPRTLTFSAFGFTDGRKGDRPNKLWEILKIFAQKDGTIDWESGGVSSQKYDLSKDIQRLGDHLKTFFRTEKKPFNDYRRDKSYKCRFEIKDLSFGGVGRANVEIENEISIPSQ